MEMNESMCVTADSRETSLNSNYEDRPSGALLIWSMQSKHYTVPKDAHKAIKGRLSFIIHYLSLFLYF